MSPKPVPESPAERAELQAALRRVYRLTYRQQVRLLNTVRLYVTDFGGEDELDDQLNERAEGLAWKLHRFQRVFGRWRFAEDEYLGRRARETPGQKALRRATSGRERKHEDYLAGVEQWLEDVKPAATTMDDYNTYRAAVNPQRVRLGALPLVVAETVSIKLKMPWSSVLECARGDAPLDAMLARISEVDIEKDAGPLGLVGMAAVARLTGRPENTMRTALDRGEFPKPMALIGTQMAWHLGDIRAWAAGNSWPARADMAWQDQLLSANELAERMGRPHAWIWKALHRWPDRLAPAAGGRVSKHRYWLLKDVEAFEAQQKPGKATS